MAKRDEIVAKLNEFFGVDKIKDYCPHGLQVEGTAEVKKVITGVSCSLALFEEAVERGAQMIVVHHGLLWTRDSLPIVGVKRKRIKTLLDNDINLVAYHLPLDAHPEIGHSALIAKGLGLVERKPFGDYIGLALGFSGRFENPQTVDDVARAVEKVCGREPLILGPKDKKISTLALASGGGVDMIGQAVSAGMDCFVSGEAKENTQAFCHEAGITFIEAGHYNSEKLGILALGDLMKERFDLEVEFVDLPNPI